jgi:hypothetical protein
MGGGWHGGRQARRGTTRALSPARLSLVPRDGGRPLSQLRERGFVWGGRTASAAGPCHFPQSVARSRSGGRASRGARGETDEARRSSSIPSAPLPSPPLPPRETTYLSVHTKIQESVSRVSSSAKWPDGSQDRASGDPISLLPCAAEITVQSASPLRKNADVHPAALPSLYRSRRSRAGSCLVDRVTPPADANHDPSAERRFFTRRPRRPAPLLFSVSSVPSV